jgi:hypothetical protein
VRVRPDVEPSLAVDLGGTEVVGEAPRADRTPGALRKRAPYRDATDLG